MAKHAKIQEQMAKDRRESTRRLSSKTLRKVWGKTRPLPTVWGRKFPLERCLQKLPPTDSTCTHTTGARTAIDSAAHTPVSGRWVKGILSKHRQVKSPFALLVLPHVPSCVPRLWHVSETSRQKELYPDLSQFPAMLSRRSYISSSHHANKHNLTIKREEISDIPCSGWWGSMYCC